MYLLIAAISVVLLVTIGVGIYLLIANSWLLRKKQILENILLTFLISTTCVFLLFSLFSIVFVNIASYEEGYDIESTTPIVAFSSNSEISGRFYIFGGGSIEEEKTYTYIEKTELGAQIKSIPITSDVYIVENNEVQPNVTVKSKRWELPEHLKKWSWIHDWLEDPITIITIPENSITYDYNVDLSNLN